MSNNKVLHPPLTRRRRRSDQVSPTSPTYARRFLDRPPTRQSDVLSPAEPSPATEGDVDSPSVHYHLTPSYTDLPNSALSSASPIAKPAWADERAYQRASEDTGRTRFRTSNEATRPASSDAVDPDSMFLHPRKPFHGPDSASRPSPVMPHSAYPDIRERRSFDPPVVRPGDPALSPNLRNQNFATMLADRGLNDEPPPSKASAGKKSRLNLLNPMSLLARRRSSQNQKLEDVNLTINTLSVPAMPDNFDPSIRGKVVHDFSAPRSRRLNSSSDLGSFDSPGIRSALRPDPSPSARFSSGTPNRMTHSPMFQEHFQDDRPALQPERTGYLQNMAAFNMAHDAQDPVDVPAFAKRLPAAVPQPNSYSTKGPQVQKEEPFIQSGDREVSPAAPPPPPKRTPSPKFDMPPPAALPKHMTSTSSRFSFQLVGSGSSAQEKLLEEKHKEYAASRPAKNQVEEDEDDPYADYDFDAEDAFEEEIPSSGFDDDGPRYASLGNALQPRYAAQEEEIPTSGLDDDYGNGGFGNVNGGNALKPRYAVDEEEIPTSGFDYDDDVHLGNAMKPRYAAHEEEIPTSGFDDDYGDDSTYVGNAMKPRYAAYEEEVPTSGLNDDDDDDGTYQANAMKPRYATGDEEIPTSGVDDSDFGSTLRANAMQPRYAPIEEDEIPSSAIDNKAVVDDVPISSPPPPRHPPPPPPPLVVQVPSEDLKTTTLNRYSLQQFHFTPQSMTFSPTSTNNGSQPTPRDHEGFAIGIANSRENSEEFEAVTHKPDQILEIDPVPMSGGLGILAAAPARTRRSSQMERPHAQVFDDDDLYFDDGEFGPVDMAPPGESFDEHIFDDENGAIRDIPAENLRKYEAARAAAGPEREVEVMKSSSAVDLPHRSGSDPLPNLNGGSTTSSNPTDISLPNPAAQEISLAGLTEGNLAAYHDALAFAANQAAADGKFDRQVSFSQGSDTSQSPIESNNVGRISGDSRFSYNFSSAIAEDDGFPFDDDMDEDAMIAAANAEALENDDDGFYGQEFGFYARAHTKGQSEMVNGGYFAERGSNGVKRSHSGKTAFQEPSLTPITERSEWSTRNSVVSLQIPGAGQSMPSPGIAQLLEMDSPSFDEDMSFSALWKLRGRTFGGSSSSLNSMGAAGHSVTSPLAHSHPFLSSSHMSSSIHGRASPAGIPESEEEDDDDMDRPTLTQNTPRKKSAEPVVHYDSHEEMPTATLAAPEERPKGHHSRTSSGAESVSYALGHDGRWVLERRRTDEEKGLEVIDREYLPSGRI